MVWLEYVLPLIFLAPLGAMAMVVIGLRNLQDSHLNSPYDGRLLRESGQSLRDRLDRAFSGLFLNAALGPIVTMMPLVYGMGRMLFADHHSWLEWALYGLLSTLFAMTCCFVLMRDAQRIRRLKLGLACDLAVGQELERLIRPEAHPFFVFHDVPTDSYTIDHVVVTPHGLFVVQTHARSFPYDPAGQPQMQVAVENQRLRFPGWSERASLRKARLSAAWLRQWLARECGVDVPVRGVLVLPGWQIDIESAPPDIMVTDGSALADKLDATPLRRLDAACHQRVVQALADRLKRFEAIRASRSLTPP
ncbi:nuclease-related domain-containing protein [Halomonas sp. WWR20]